MGVFVGDSSTRVLLRGMNCGPWEYNDNLYTVCADTTNNQVEVYKSTDGGVTWSEQDSADKPSFSSTSTRKVVAAQREGDSLFVLYHHTDDATSRISEFDMTTDSWNTSPITGGPNLREHPGPSTYWFGFTIRSDGDYIVFHQGAPESVMGVSRRRVNYSRHESGVWTNDISASSSQAGTARDYEYMGVYLGSSDRAHFFFERTTAPIERMHRSLTSGNSLNTEQTISSVGGWTVNSLGTRVDRDGTIYICHPFTSIVSSIDTANFDHAASADNPTWTQTRIDDATVTSEEVDASRPVVMCASADGRLFAFWDGNNITPDTNEYYATDDGQLTTWNPDIELSIESNIAQSGFCIGHLPGRSELGVMYEPNSSPRAMYDKIYLPSARMTMLGQVIQRL